MCFIVTDKTLHVAEEDITCYKSVFKREDLSMAVSACYCSPYILHARYNVPELVLVEYFRDFVIEAGFHSYINDNNYEYAGDHARFIIPKGAHFYKNDTQYVSDAIIMVEFLS